MAERILQCKWTRQGSRLEYGSVDYSETYEKGLPESVAIALQHIHSPEFYIVWEPASAVGDAAPQPVEPVEAESAEAETSEPSDESEPPAKKKRSKKAAEAEE